MITFKPVVSLSSRRKDGTYPVRIRVTFKSQVRRLPTTLVCTASDLTRSGKIKTAEILNKAEALVGQMRSAVSNLSPFDIASADVDWIVSHIKKQLSASSFRLDFFEFGNQYALTKSPGTCRGFQSSLNVFSRFLGRNAIDINDITKTMIQGFVDSHRCKPSTMSLYITRLSAIYQASKDKYNDEDAGTMPIPRSPFRNIARPRVVGFDGQKPLSVEQMQSLIDDKTVDWKTRATLDVFLLSFCLMGANFADLYEAVPPTGEWWVYNRRKTRSRRADKAEMRVLIPPQAERLVKRLKNGKYRGVWLGVLKQLSKGDQNSTARTITNRLKSYQKSHDLPEFTFYAARHTWATLARRIGIEKATIDECLAHVGDFAIADIYAERNWDLINDANRRVLELFEWPEY